MFDFHRNTNDDTMLMTKAMKERKEIERAAAFQKVTYFLINYYPTII